MKGLIGVVAIKQVDAESSADEVYICCKVTLIEIKLMCGYFLFVLKNIYS